MVLPSASEQDHARRAHQLVGTQRQHAVSRNVARGAIHRRPDVARMVVADRQPLMLAGMCHFAATRPWLEVAGLAGSGRSAVDQASEIRPEIALVDPGMADMSGVELVRELCAVAPGVRVVLHTADGSPAAIAAVAQAGAAAVVHKESGLTELAETLHRVIHDARCGVVPATRPEQQAGQRLNGLTMREHEILRLVATGQTNGEIAAELGLALNTVKTYFQRTLEKLGVHNRVEALLRAVELGLL